MDGWETNAGGILSTVVSCCPAVTGERLPSRSPAVVTLPWMGQWQEGAALVDKTACLATRPETVLTDHQPCQVDHHTNFIS